MATTGKLAKSLSIKSRIDKIHNDDLGMAVETRIHYLKYQRKDGGASRTKFGGFGADAANQTRSFEAPIWSSTHEE